MDQNKGFSLNTLVNALRATFENAKDKFSTDMIQEIMNLITDIEHEAHLLQTNYKLVAQQNEQIEHMNQSVQEIFRHLATSQLPTINESSENVTQHSTQTSPAKSAVDSNVVSDTSHENVDHDEVTVMAELISDLVVKKLSELDTAE